MLYIPHSCVCVCQEWGELELILVIVVVVVVVRVVAVERKKLLENRGGASCRIVSYRIVDFIIHSSKEEEK